MISFFELVYWWSGSLYTYFFYMRRISNRSLYLFAVINTTDYHCLLKQTFASLDAL